MSPILAAIRSMLPDADLRAHMTDRTVHRVAASGAIDPSAILTLETIEQALIRGVVPVNELRVFGGYNRLDLVKVGVVKDDSFRPMALRSLARQGATLVVNKVQRLTPELWDLACELERWLGTRVALAAIVSFGLSGIDAHYDYGDVIIVHLAGEKKWHFLGQPMPLSGGPFAHHPGERSTDITGEADMAPGDVMFVPSGLMHRCVPGGYSLHLGISVDHPSGTNFAKHLSEQALAETKLSDPLRSFLGRDAVIAEAERIKQLMIARIEAADPLAWLAQHEARRARIQGVDLAPGEAVPAEGTATLNVSIGPDLSVDGTYVAGGISLGRTPVIDALIEILRIAPHPVARLQDVLISDHSKEEVVAALTRLVDTGIVRIEFN